MGTAKFAGILLALMPAASLAQDSFAQKHGILKITTPAQASGTAFVIAEPQDGIKLLATANHVTVMQDSQGRDMPGYVFAGDSYILSLGDKRWKGSAFLSDEKSDIAIVKAAIPEDFEILEIDDTSSPPPDKDYIPPRIPVRFYGYTGTKDFTQTLGYFSFQGKDYSWADGVLIPGQSGGPAVTGNVIVGVNSGGSEWYKGPQGTVTWPARIGSAKRLKEILEDAKKRLK